METLYKKSLKIIQDMTASLKGDEELHRDVTQELILHFEESVASYRKEGKTEEESHDLALKALGDPKLIAEELADSNKSRMKIRAYIGLLLKRILVPASLIITVWMGMHYAQRLDLISLLGYMPDGPSMKKVEASLSESSRFLLYGDTSRTTRSAQERAIWEKHPENKAYFANYARMLLFDYRNKSLNISYEDLEKEFRKGEALDPENSFYNYLLASILFEKGSEIAIDKKNEKNPSQFVIKDEASLDAAVKELKKAKKKPFYKRYYEVMLNERLDSLPETKRLEDDIVKIAFSAGTLLPELAPTKNLFSKIPQYVETKELRGDEASSLLDCWEDFVRKATPDTWCLIDVLVMDAIISISGEKVSEVYRSFGNDEAASRTLELVEQANQPVANWKAQRENNESYDFITKQKGGMLASMLLPALDEPITEEDLRPGRMAERVIGEQFVLTIIIITLGVMLVATWAFYLNCKKLMDGNSSPVLLLPTGDLALKAFGLGILLPIGLYFVYTRWTGLSSYEFSLSFEWPRGLAEFLLLTLTYLSLSLNISASYFAKRCKSLGIPVETIINPIVGKIFWICLSIAWLFCVTKNGLLGESQHGAVFLTLGISLLLFFIVLVFITLRKAWISRKSHGLFFGSLSRSLLPVYACAVIFLGAICLPYIQKKESYFLSQDPLLFPDTKTGFFSALEDKVTQRLKTSMEKALME